MDDRELLRMLRDREEPAMEQLFVKYGGLMRYVAGGILRDDREVEECANDICLRVWENAASYDPERASLSTWLTVIARNTAINRKRTLDRQENREEELGSYADCVETPEEHVLRKERSEQLEKALNTLDTRARSLFFRKYYYQQSTAQIAAEMGMTERGVEGKLYRLRKRLQKALGGEQR